MRDWEAPLRLPRIRSLRPGKTPLCLMELDGNSTRLSAFESSYGLHPQTDSDPCESALLPFNLYSLGRRLLMNDACYNGMVDRLISCAAAKSIRRRNWGQSLTYNPY